MTDLGREGQKRKLRAILYGDVAGYTRLTQANELVTHETLLKYRKIIAGQVLNYNGRMIDMSGDSVLAEFESATSALSCAITMQKRLKEENKHLPADRRMEFRIGLSAGDIIVDENGIYGDEVNISERVQRLAKPGEVCISESIYHYVKNRLLLGYEYLGEHQIKKHEAPVKAYLIHPDAKGAMMMASPRESPGRLPTQLYRRSIAVLPLKNLSADPEQDYFSDGIAEDIITGLSKFRHLFVIARNSSFMYKGIQASPSEISSELGVRYLLEGSVRKAGDRVRVTAQLVDAENNRNVWGSGYDRDIKLNDIFEAQDEIAQAIVVELPKRLEDVERESALRIPTENLEAYDCVLRGEQFHLSYTREGNLQARRMYDRARQLDAGYARAFAALSRTHNDDWRFRWSESPTASLDKALDYALQAVVLDPWDARAYAELGLVYLYRKQLDESLRAYNKALSLNPNDADIMADMGDVVAYDGRSEEAVDLIKKAMRLNPFYPDRYLWHLGGAYYVLRRYEDAITTMSAMMNADQAHRLLAASYAQLNKTDEARFHARQILRVQPNFDAEEWANKQPERDPDEIEHLKEGLHKALALLE
jgi:TolB-like protein